MTTSKISPLRLAKNIGSKLEQRLNKIGINDLVDLQTVTPSAAYQKMQEQWPQETLPVCYYLYSLEGALLDIPWESLSPQRKRKLRLEAGLKK